VQSLRCAAEDFQKQWKTAKEDISGEMKAYEDNITELVNKAKDTDVELDGKTFTVGELYLQQQVASQESVSPPEEQTENPGDSKPDYDALAQAVLRGEYGSGQQRRDALGADYDEVQARVNMLAGGAAAAAGARASSGGSGAASSAGPVSGDVAGWAGFNDYVPQDGSLNSWQCVSGSWYFIRNYLGYAGPYIPVPGSKGGLLAQALAQSGRFSLVSTPAPGDIVSGFSNGWDGGYGHTGIVTRVEGNTVYYRATNEAAGPGTYSSGSYTIGAHGEQYARYNG
jgi:hypothetical protein